MSLKYSELDFLNETRIPPTYNCPTGYTLIDRFCELIPNMSCPPTYELINGICMKKSGPVMETVSNTVPSVTVSNTVPSVTVSNTVPSVTVSNTVPSVTVSNTVPVSNTMPVSPPCPTGYVQDSKDQMCYPF